jgi:two-component system, NarL family, response regulator NreC
MAISVFIADGHPAFMKGIAEKLRKEMNLVVTIADEETTPVLDYLLQYLPDIFIYFIDTNGEKKNFPLLRNIRKARGEKIQVIAISNLENSETYRSFFHLGGNGFILRNNAEAEIVLAVRTILKGYLFICCHLQHLLLKKILAIAPVENSDFLLCLSPREREVVSLMQKGKTTHEIADVLFLSSGYIEGVKKSIMRKLGVHDKTDLMRKILFSDLE